jgi:hypothetical protein
VYLEKERLSPLHSTVVSFLVEITPSFSKRIRKYPLVKRVVEMNKAGRWSFKHSYRALKVILPPKVHPITVMQVFLATLLCISITMSVGNSASSCKL